MRVVICLLVALFCPMAVAAVQPAADIAVPSSTAQTASVAATPDRKKISYAIGYRIGRQLSGDGLKLDLPSLMQAIRDAHAGRAPAVSSTVMTEQLDLLERQMHQQAQQAFQQLAKENADKSRAFLRANGKKHGVVTLPSGVQYRVLEKGRGASPVSGSTVVINYRGALINGMEFDSSWAHGKPVTYAVRDMLPGWREVLPRMHVGARWKVYIPPDEAYGSRGQLPRIGPNEALVFDIQLLDVLQ